MSRGEGLGGVFRHDLLAGQVLVGRDLPAEALAQTGLAVQRVLLDFGPVRAGLPGPLGVLLDRALQVALPWSTLSAREDNRQEMRK
ncbi:MAG: hypothetical protein WBF17_17230 [Phycisphaerae bacterium]